MKIWQNKYVLVSLKDEYESAMCSKVIRTVTNVFLNNKRKQSTESVTENRVVEFKKVKRNK